MTTETEVEKPVEVKKKKPKNYINNADLLIEIELSREKGKMTNNLARMLMMLADRYSKHSDYSRIYSYEEDMKAFAMLTLVKVWGSFNPEKSKNPFAYFTQIIRHAFYQYLNHEKKQREIKDVILIDIGETPSFTYMENYNEQRAEDEVVGEVTDGEVKSKYKVYDYTPEPITIEDGVSEDDLGGETVYDDDDYNRGE